MCRFSRLGRTVDYTSENCKRVGVHQGVVLVIFWEGGVHENFFEINNTVTWREEEERSGEGKGGQWRARRRAAEGFIPTLPCRPRGHRHDALFRFAPATPLSCVFPERSYEK